ncbi:DUF6612 family protein [Lysinibacillus endophyticus]|uniref:DUF6612 family protein n=1 Tax=Ureibacillus endophyticus TaxID=1978490 RepID=UPI0020A10D61|nr:DUF6612 family protein [Lysinibacillus endophyticus]MCP1146316.1 hypothetical protein [Lysinibacillus endophyticus]
MKKWGYAFFTSLLVFVLAACSETAEPKTGTKEESKSELTLQEVYDKAIERQNELESVSADMKMNQVITFGSGEEKFVMGTKSNMKMDMIVDPLAMYMDGTMTMEDPDSGDDINVDMEMYMSEQGLFMQDSESKQWMKLPSDQFDMVMGQTANQANAAEQLEALKSFIDEFKFEQTDSEYVLTLSAASDKFKEYMLEQMQLNQMLGVPSEEEEMFENMTFDKVNYTININKDNFDILSMDMVVNMGIGVEGQEISMEMNTNITFDNVNGVKNIVVPQEVIDKAVEIEQ